MSTYKRFNSSSLINNDQLLSSPERKLTPYYMGYNADTTEVIITPSRNTFCITIATTLIGIPYLLSIVLISTYNHGIHFLRFSRQFCSFGSLCASSSSSRKRIGNESCKMHLAARRSQRKYEHSYIKNCKWKNFTPMIFISSLRRSMIKDNKS